MKNLSKKMYIILVSVLFGFLGFWFLLSTCLTIPGQGLESLNFIKSVEKQIDRLMPKGKFAVRAQAGFMGITAGSTIKTSYEAEVLSTLDFPDIDDYQAAIKAENTEIMPYINFVDNWFDAKWGDVIADENGFIDLNEVGHDLVDMDKAIAKEFHSSSLITAGIQFLYTNGSSVKEMFSKSLMDDSKAQERVESDEDYDKSLTYSYNVASGALGVKKSVGTYIANNKVWFLNTQRTVLSKTLDSNFLKDTDWKSGSKPMTGDEYLEQNREVTIDDISKPNYSSSLKLLQAGTIMTIMTVFFAAAIIPLGTLIIIWNRN